MHTYATKASGLNIFSKFYSFFNRLNLLFRVWHFQVVEKNPAFWKSDVDFIKPGSLFTMNWENVFIGSSGMIEKFNVYLSTFKGGK